MVQQGVYGADGACYRCDKMVDVRIVICHGSVAAGVAVATECLTESRAAEQFTIHMICCT